MRNVLINTQIRDKNASKRELGPGQSGRDGMVHNGGRQMMTTLSCLTSRDTIVTAAVQG